MRGKKSSLIFPVCYMIVNIIIKFTWTVVCDRKKIDHHHWNNNKIWSKTTCYRIRLISSVFLVLSCRRVCLVIIIIIIISLFKWLLFVCLLWIVKWIFITNRSNYWMSRECLCLLFWLLCLCVFVFFP